MGSFPNVNAKEEINCHLLSTKWLDNSHLLFHFSSFFCHFFLKVLKWEVGKRASSEFERFHTLVLCGKLKFVTVITPPIEFSRAHVRLPYGKTDSHKALCGFFKRLRYTFDESKGSDES